MVRGSASCVVALLLVACASDAQEAEPAPRPKASQRHQEWTDVSHDRRAVRCFVVYPEVSRPAPAVIVLHENKGLTDWVRSVADRLAEEGFVAVAPDLLSGAGPGGGGTESFAKEEDATAAIYKLAPAQVAADLQAVADRAKTLTGADGTICVAGFCWGGAQSFQFATERPELTAAFVFYGAAPQDDAAIARIAAPVYGFYGGNDARINAGLAATEEKMRRAGKTFEPVVYADAGHAFLRVGENTDAEPANRKARDAAWKRWLELLRRR